MTRFQTVDVKTKWRLKQQPQQANTDTQKAKLWESIFLKLLSQEAFLAVGWAWGWKYSWRFPRAGTPNVSSCFPRLSSSRPLTGRRKGHQDKWDQWREKHSHSKLMQTPRQKTLFTREAISFPPNGVGRDSCVKPRNLRGQRWHRFRRDHGVLLVNFYFTKHVWKVRRPGDLVSITIAATEQNAMTREQVDEERVHLPYISAV